MKSRKIIPLLLALAIFSGAVVADDGVFIFGGTRGVGLEAVKQLVEAGRSVTVLVRPSSDLTALSKTGAKTVVGDALNRDSIDAALATGAFDAAISTLSGSPESGYDADSVGNINAIDASADAGVERFVLISSIGVGDSADALPQRALDALKTVLEAKGEAEDHLRASGLDYTIIRPAGLTNKPASGEGYLTEDTSAGGIISRAEVARLAIDALSDADTLGKTLSAVE